MLGCCFLARTLVFQMLGDNINGGLRFWQSLDSITFAQVYRVRIAVTTPTQTDQMPLNRRFAKPLSSAFTEPLMPRPASGTPATSAFGVSLNLHHAGRVSRESTSLRQFVRRFFVWESDCPTMAPGKAPTHRARLTVRQTGRR